MIVTFQDNLAFRARANYVQNVAYSQKPNNNTQQALDSKMWQGVNYDPKYHRIRLTSAKFSFSTPNCHSKPDYKENEKHEIESEKEIKKTPRDVTLPKLIEKKKDFERKFRLKKPQDDRVWRAREWRAAMMVQQYKNPEPYDHRGLDEPLDGVSLRTLETPDPYNIHLKTQCLTDQYKQYPVQHFSTRDINFRLNTLKTPEPHFDKTLLHFKGRYSPAFSAYNAYLDRVCKSISMN